MCGLTLVLVLAITQKTAEPKVETRTLLPVVPNAVDVTRRRVQGAKSVEYDVRESYPAPKTIAYLTEAMARRGWKLNQIGAFRPPQWILVAPGKPRRGSMSDLIRATPLKTHVWEAWWRDASGRAAAFSLVYQCPMEQKGLHSVWVHVIGTIYEPEEATRQEAARKRLHDELCQAVREGDLPPTPGCEE